MSTAVRGLNEVFNCFMDSLVKALNNVLEVPLDDLEKAVKQGRLKIAKTPDPSMGDYGVSIHQYLIKHGVAKEDWNSVGYRISSFIEENYSNVCRIMNVRFINGYVNFSIDYATALRKIVEELAYDSHRLNVGGGKHVIVEHTSANPVHPLHVGSGRNSVIGDTYARLLRYIGFDVNTRFYVNDMGRQVAVLVYGYSILRRLGVKPNPSTKIDHWFGVVYALTNILMEKARLVKDMERLSVEIRNLLNDNYMTIKELTVNSKDFVLLEILIELSHVMDTTKLVHSPESVYETVTYLKDRVEKVKESVAKDLVKRFIVDLEAKVTKFKELFNQFRELLESESKMCILDRNLCGALSKEIKDYDEAEESIRSLMVKLEERDFEVKGVFKEVVEQVLSGFKETLNRLNIHFDSFDYETDVHEVYTKKVLSEVLETGHAEWREGALVVDLDKVASENHYVKRLFEPDRAGKVTLMRSDGTTLYVTRDVGYSIYKLKDLGAHRVYNVIAIEQEREQKQVKAILHLLGYRDYLDNLIHFPYEMVILKGRSMSGRRGEYYTVDELVGLYRKFVTENYVENQVKLGKESFDMKLDDYLDNLEKLAVACSRALLLSVDPRKVLVFDPSKPEEYDVGAWIVYTFVRLQGIVRKAFGFEPLDSIDELKASLRKLLGSLSKGIELSEFEKNVVEHLMSFKEVIIKAYEELNPSEILVYTNQLCQVLNKFYETHPVVNEPDPIRKAVRLSIVASSLLVLRDLMEIMGFPLIRRL